MLSESIKVSNEDLAAYCIVVAEQYAKLPLMDQSVLSLWEDVISHNNKMLKRILSGVTIYFTKEDPYKNQREMMLDILKNKRMYIFKTESDESHVGMSAAENDVFRAVHDFLGHYKPIQKEFEKFVNNNNIKTTDSQKFKTLRFSKNSFTVRGEMNTYFSHGALLPKKLRPVLFTEIVGQICTYFVTNNFTINKVGVMKGIDFENIGFFTDRKLEQRMGRYAELLRDESVKEIPTKMGKINKSELRWNLLSRGAGQTVNKKLESSENKDYNVNEMKEGKKMPNINESSLSRIHSKIDSVTVGMLSAFRGDKSLAVNKSNSRILRASLIEQGFDVTKIVGSYIEQYGSDNAQEVKEESYFVAETKKSEGKLVDAIIEQGKRFNQDSVFIKPKGKSGYLYGISKRPDAWPAYQQIEHVGVPVFGKEGEFFSRVRNRPFTFESVDQVEAPQTYLGKMGNNKLSKHQPE